MTDFHRFPRPLLNGLMLLGLLLATASATAVAAVDEEDLLPVDEAFVLSATAPDRNRIELQWQIADGYYLYRHRFQVRPLDERFKTNPLQLPDGERYEDEFFGEVETYRQQVTAVLTGAPGDDMTTLPLEIKYQGCADIGICYPPQTRRIDVAIPASNGSAMTDAVDPLPDTTSGLRLPGSVGTSSAVNTVDDGNRLQAPTTVPGGADRPLPPEQAFGVIALADDGNTVRVRFEVAPGYYLYRDKSAFGFEDTDGLTVGRPQWPPGTPHRDEYFGETTVYFDPVEVVLPVQRSHADAVEAQLVVELQGCQTDGICYPPMTRTLAVSLPAGKVAAASAGGNPSAPTGPRRPLNLFTALLLALGGGVILNLMPCVLPVLSLKALSLAGNGEDPARARRHALWYTAGVMLSFAALGGLALGLRQAGLALGWGFQLQQPLVVAVLALLMFVLGLSLSGVWHIGGRWTGVGHELTMKTGPAGDFFTGVLAVIVATPCTAPFMGAALAWAFTADTATALLVFLALGLGLALPFLLIGFIPALAHRLPRPGAWMDTFKQLLAFPLYLTAVWLAWVLARQRGADAIALFLVAATLLAFAAWAWTRARRDGRRWAVIAAALALVAAVWPLQRIHVMPRPQSSALASPAHEALAPVAFSEQRLAELRAAGRPVFVNVTADWCVTCKANEKTVFARDGFREALQAANAVYMVGDWTDVEPELTGFLERHGAVGVPLYVVYPADGGEGRVLPLVLTPDTARQALLDAAAP